MLFILGLVNARMLFGSFLAHIYFTIELFQLLQHSGKFQLFFVVRF